MTQTFAQIKFAFPSTISIPPGRYRRDFKAEALTELAASIDKVGLINPILLRTRAEGGLEIVAGERRLRALCSLLNQGKIVKCGGLAAPSGQVPFISLEEISDPLILREIELDENIRRVDLSWQERVEAIAGLHKLRSSQHSGEWSLADTAKELADATGSTPASTTSLYDAVLLAENLTRPEVRAARSQRDGIKALYRSIEAEFQSAITLQIGPPGKDASSPFQVEHIDARKGLRALTSESVDVFLTDPPYGMGADSFGVSELSLGRVHTYSDKWKEIEPLLRSCLGLMFLAAKANAHLYLMCDLLHFFEIKAMAEAHSWIVWPRPLIWYKGGHAGFGGHAPNALFGPQREYECILYALKGRRSVIFHASDVILTPGVPGREAEGAAQKPVALYTNLLKRSARPGDMICDPFCGTGTIFEAAFEMKLRASGFDLDPAMVFLSRERIKGLGGQSA